MNESYSRRNFLFRSAAVAGAVALGADPRATARAAGESTEMAIAKWSGSGTPSASEIEKAAVRMTEQAIDALVRRVRDGTFRELVMATNPTVEGDGTALHISNLLSEVPSPIRITRLARGITSGSVLEFANKEILSDALTGRREF